MLESPLSRLNLLQSNDSSPPSDTEGKESHVNYSESPFSQEDVIKTIPNIELDDAPRPSKAHSSRFAMRRCNSANVSKHVLTSLFDMLLNHQCFEIQKPTVPEPHIIKKRLECSSFETAQSSVNTTINWDKYQPINIMKCNPFDQRVAFGGIISYIYKSSKNRLNLAEIVFRCKSISVKANIDPYSVMSLDSSFYYSTDKNHKGQWLSFQLTNVIVNPTAYSIMSDINQHYNPRLRSFAFQARLTPEDYEWTTLDEQYSINSLDESGSFKMFYIDTDKYYNEFRILQTGPALNQINSFSINALDLHGAVLPHVSRIQDRDSLSLFSSPDL